MKKRFRFILAASMLVAMLPTPVAAHNETETAIRIQQVGNSYRVADTYAIDENTTIPIKLQEDGFVYKSDDSRYFYEAENGLIVEVGHKQIPSTCRLFAEELGRQYEISEWTAKRVYEILNDPAIPLADGSSIQVYSPDLLASGRASSTYTGYKNYTYKDDVVSWNFSSDPVPMYSSKTESKSSLLSKGMSILLSTIVGGVVSLKDYGLLTFAQLGIDLNSVGVVFDYNDWQHTVQLRATQTEKLTSVLYGGTYTLGARTTKIQYDFKENFSSGVGKVDKAVYSKVFNDSTPSFSNPSQKCYENFSYDVYGEMLDYIKHGSAVFAVS